MSNLKPQHIGFILDGNRRWAKERGLPAIEGHRVGYARMKEVVQWCNDRDIPYITIFVFSTENWKRSKEEVKYLFKLIKRALTKDLKEFHKQNFRVRVMGRVKGLNDDLQQVIKAAEERTKDNKKGVLTLAINYGGRAQITDAVKQLMKDGIDVAKVDEARIAAYMDTAGIPDPDLIIRTSGEKRLSGFLLWQAAYSELYFEDKLWPDFTEHDLDRALEEYKNRQRRFGE